MSREVQRTIIAKHNRWAAWLVACISKHMAQTGLEANIRVVKDGEEYKLGPVGNLPLMRMLMIGAAVGDELEVLAEGPDATEALEVFEVTVHKCASAGFRGTGKPWGFRD